MNVTLYTTHCPKCQVLEKKLGQKKIEYVMIDDTNKVAEFGEENKILSAPILDVDGIVLDFQKAVKWVNER